MLSLGTKAPEFSLRDVVSEKMVGLDLFPNADAYVMAFICNHCPYVIHIRDCFSKLGNEALDRNVGFFAISSNDASNYPADRPEKMAEEAKIAGYRFPYLYDETQAIAKAYQAACTPDFFVFDSNLRLAYRGQFDESRPGNGKIVSGESLRKAIHAICSGQPATAMQAPSLGCNIKWIPGNAPDYFG